MFNFFRNVICLFRVLFIVSKYQILTNPGKTKLPKYSKIFANFVAIFFYPKAIFFQPKESFGDRLAECFKYLGPIYIKFGQTLSTRPDLIGVEVVDSLKNLQDKLPPFDTKIATATIESNLGKKIEQVFAKFDETPVAAASIAQVHKAELLSGEKVAVKILRPDIHKIYAKDIKFLEFLAYIATKILPYTKRLKPREVISIFAQTMHFELNLKSEAAAASKLYDNFQDDNTIHIPKIYWAYTTENIITLEWIDGVSIYDKTQIEKFGIDPVDVAKKIAIAFFNMAYRDGFFHADMHPGNIFVTPEGKIALLDFGIMGSLPEKDRYGIAEILYALLKRDYTKVAKIHLRIGYIPSHTNVELFAQSLRAVAEPIIGLALKDISIGYLLGNLFKVTEKYGMETQPQLIMLQKTIIVVEGIGQSLDPNINIWQLAEPWIKKWATKNLTFEAKLYKLIKRFFHEIFEDEL